MVFEIQFWSVNYTLVARICKNRQMIRQKQYILGFKVKKTSWITFHTAKHFSTILPVIMRLFIKNGSFRWRASCIWTVNFKQLQEVEVHSTLKVHYQVSEYFWNWKPFKNTGKPYLTLLVLMIFRFLSWIFGHVEKRLD